MILHCIQHHRITLSVNCFLASQFVGRTKLTFRLEDLRNLTRNNYIYAFEVEASLQETLTGSTVTESKRVTVYRTSTKVEFDPASSRTFKPGLTYSVVVSIYTFQLNPKPQQNPYVNPLFSAWSPAFAFYTTVVPYFVFYTPDISFFLFL